MLMQHVMYKDILANRMYVSYPYYEAFDINNDDCLYCYANNEKAMHEYIDTYTKPEYIEENLIAKLKEHFELSEANETRILKLFSSTNPSVRLSVYAGGTIDRAKVFEDIYSTGDIKKVLIELTGEINAIAMDGLFSLYASALKYLEGKEHTANTKLLQENYLRLIAGSYIYMKRGSAMDFFFMPIADIEKAIDNKSVDMLMDSANTFTDVYLRNNSIVPILED